MRLQLETVGLGHMWVDGDLDAISTELTRRLAFAGTTTAGGRALMLASGLTECWRGDFVASAEVMDAVRFGAADRDDAFSTLLAGSVLGLIATLRGQTERADREFDAVLALAGRVGAPAVEVTARSIRVAMADGLVSDEIAEELEHCRATAIRLSRPDVESTVDMAEGWALASQGRFTESADLLDRSADRLEAPLERALARLRRAEVLTLDGRGEEARHDASLAADTFTNWKSRYWAARSALVLASMDGDRGGRRVGAVLARMPDDPAYTRMFEPAGSFCIDLRRDPVVTRDGVALEFLTRHAEAAVRLLAAAKGAGLPTEELAATLWPDAEPSRVAQRIRTMLWQVRSGLGPDSWRLQRCRDIITLDLTGVDVVGRLDRQKLAESFGARR